MEVVLGMSPILIRKKKDEPNLHIIYGSSVRVSYCDIPVAIDSNIWHHFAFSISISGNRISCYQDGFEYDVNSNPVEFLTQNHNYPTELVLGHTKTAAFGEEPF